MGQGDGSPVPLPLTRMDVEKRNSRCDKKDGRMEYLNGTREPSLCPFVENGASYKYVYNGSQLVQMTVNGQKVTFTYDAAGTPLTMKVYTVIPDPDDASKTITNCDTYYYITNLQGDVMALVDDDGNTVVSYAYTAYGETTVTDHDENDDADINPLTYRGYVFDSETGLSYLQSRYYDPVVGRFINADAVACTGQGFIGNNMFAYCGNNPVNYADPTGLSFEDPSTELEWMIYDIIEYIRALFENLAAWVAILKCDPICPVDEYRNSNTDTRYGAPRADGARTHEGIDFYPSDSEDNEYYGGDGTPMPVRAMNDGYIKSITWDYYGNTQSVTIDHQTYTAHYCEIQLSEALIRAWKGDGFVKQGDIIGTMLQTSAPYCRWTLMLHLEIEYEGEKINPTLAYYFRKWK